MEVPLQSSVSVLVESPGTEECGDWWAPESRSATAGMRVEPAQPVGELWILASRAGGDSQVLPPEDRGTTQLRITYVSVSGQSRDQVVRLYDYPDWTVVTPPFREPLSKISIQSVDYLGDGPAVAAVKAFKSGW
jgi:hypothetical protein